MRKKILTVMVLVMLVAMLLAGCGKGVETSGTAETKGIRETKVKDLGFTVVSEEKIPAELKTIIDEKKADPFRLTYSADEYLYIVIGYGQQASGGYSIAVNELYLTEDAIYVNTTLLGPAESENVSRIPSCPYIVLKLLDYMDQPVVFE